MIVSSMKDGCSTPVYVQIFEERAEIIKGHQINYHYILKYGNLQIQIGKYRITCGYRNKGNRDLTG